MCRVGRQTLLTNELTLHTGAHMVTAGLHRGVRPISAVFV